MNDVAENRTLLIQRAKRRVYHVAQRLARLAGEEWIEAWATEDHAAMDRAQAEADYWRGVAERVAGE